MRFGVSIQKLADYPEFKGFREIDFSQIHLIPNPSIEDKDMEQIVMKQCNLPATIAYYTCSREEMEQIQEAGIQYKSNENRPIYMRTRPHPGQQSGQCLIEVNLETIFRDGGHISLRQDGLILVRSNIHLRHVLGVIEQS
jgi:hypothetical protein